MENPRSTVGRRTENLTWLFLFIFGVVFFSPHALALEDPGCIAEGFLGLLQRGVFGEALSMEDETMQKLLPEEALQKMWKDMTENLGRLVEFRTDRVEEKGEYRVVFIVSRFERVTLMAQVAVNEKGKISGLYFVPFTSGEYSLPSSAGTESFVEREVTFGVPGFELPGTLTIPKGEGPFPCVLLVHGSGANDRDETVMACKPFRDLAFGLATRGVAVFRYDKRTYVHGVQITLSLPSFTVEEEVIEDALEALRFLRAQEDVDGENIFLLGHSLGGFVAPEIARRAGFVRGVILCAAPARPLHELVPEQMEYLFSLDGVVDEREAQILEGVRDAARKLTERVFQLGDSVPHLGGYARYFYSLMDLRPLEVAKNLSLPFLVVQGGRDYQVKERDFLLWKETLSPNPRAFFRLYPPLNHLLIPGEGSSTPKEYERPGYVDEALIEDLARWIEEQKSRPEREKPQEGS
ncbi:MAG: alpha/beta hydrolase [Candidatus Caldatribacteriaceae bacterium]